MTAKRVDTPRGVTRGGGGDTGPLPELRERVVSGDRNTGDPAKRPGGKGKRGPAPRRRPTKT